MVTKINDFTFTELDKIDAYYRDTGFLDFRLVELQSLSLNPTQEKVAITGGGGRTLSYKKRNKALSGTGTNATISAGLMKVQTGGDITYGNHTIKGSEVKKANGATITTDYAATGTAGAEIGNIQVIQLGSNAVTASYTQAITADATHFSYDPTTKTITLPNTSGAAVIADGSNVMYAYAHEVSGTKVTDPTNKFSEVRELWIYGSGTDSCDREFYAAIHIPRADFSGEFTFDLGGDQTVHNFSFDALADLCDPSIESDLFELIVFTGESAGTEGQYSVTVSTALASGDSVTIAGVEYSYDSDATTAEAQATAIQALLNATTAVTTKYTIVRSGAMIVFTEKYGYYGAGAPVVDSTGLSTGVITSATIKQGKAAE